MRMGSRGRRNEKERRGEERRGMRMQLAVGAKGRAGRYAAQKRS